MLEELSKIRKEAYLEYLSIKYKLRDDRTMFTEDKEKIAKAAYEKYLEIDKKVEEAEDLFILEQAHRELKSSYI